MVRRFLTYSLDHNRPVKVLFSDTMRYKNITVVLLEGETVGYLTAGRKKPLSALVILSLIWMRLSARLMNWAFRWKRSPCVFWCMAWLTF